MNFSISGGGGHFLLFPAKYFPTWWGIGRCWQAIEINPHLYPGVGRGGVEVYFDWCITLYCPRALRITCLSHKGQNSVQRKTFKVLRLRGLPVKNTLAVERG